MKFLPPLWNSWSNSVVKNTPSLYEFPFTVDRGDNPQKKLIKRSPICTEAGEVGDGRYKKRYTKRYKAL